jgi:hypothetical protein
MAFITRDNLGNDFGIDHNHYFNMMTTGNLSWPVYATRNGSSSVRVANSWVEFSTYGIMTGEGMIKYIDIPSNRTGSKTRFWTGMAGSRSSGNPMGFAEACSKIYDPAGLGLSSAKQNFMRDTATFYGDDSWGYAGSLVNPGLDFFGFLCHAFTNATTGHTKMNTIDWRAITTPCPIFACVWRPNVVAIPSTSPCGRHHP